LTQRIRKKGMPVAIAPVNRQMNRALIQLPSQSSNQLAALIVDRAPAAKVIIMGGNFQQAPARDIPAARNIF